MKRDTDIARYELKYYLSLSDYLYARSVLKHFMKPDTYQLEEDGYFIRSLYFDTIHDTSVEEKLAGIEKRDKYRLRIYYFDQDWAKLERKHKFGDYVQKCTTIVTKNDALAIANGKYDSLLENDNPNAQSLYADFKRRYLTPVVVVDYIREAFIIDENNVRITFDKKLRATDRCFDLYRTDLVTEPLQRDDTIIMEVKFDRELPAWFASCLHFKTATRSAISKYCLSRMRAIEYDFTLSSPQERYLANR